jgi:hypothetical protein
MRINSILMDINWLRFRREISLLFLSLRLNLYNINGQSPVRFALSMHSFYHLKIYFPAHSIPMPSPLFAPCSFFPASRCTFFLLLYLFPRFCNRFQRFHKITRTGTCQPLNYLMAQQLFTITRNFKPRWYIHLAQLF